MADTFLDLDGIDNRASEGAILGEAEVHRLTGRIRGLLQIAQMAIQVRLAQKAYFRSRTPDALVTAKDLEVKLDGQLITMEKQLEAQLSLFDVT